MRDTMRKNAPPAFDVVETHNYSNGTPSSDGEEKYGKGGPVAELDENVFGDLDDPDRGLSPEERARIVCEEVGDCYLSTR